MTLEDLEKGSFIQEKINNLKFFQSLMSKEFEAHHLPEEYVNRIMNAKQNKVNKIIEELEEEFSSLCSGGKKK